jgi:penicillin-binding protein 2A
LKLEILKNKWLHHPIIKWGLVAIFSIVLISIIGYYLILFGGKMVVDEEGFIFSEATVILNADKEEVATLYSQNRTFVSIDQIPEHVQNAFIAIEDERFYEHAGVDFPSVLRALYKDIIAMDKVEGASTITQQLVKNVFLTNEKTWLRKTKEVMGAIYLEHKVPKKKILEYYLNQIYFGHGIYGIEKAAQYFFGKSVQDLNVAEGALLAAIPKSPSYYSPIDYPENALKRRNLVLSNMEDLGMINVEEKKALQGRTLGLQISETLSRPWVETYVDLVLQEAEEKYHISREEIYRGGYKIITGINPTAQQIAYEQFQNDAFFSGSMEGAEGAFVLMDGETGAIVAAIGGRNFKRGDMNRIFVKRQPGSVMKPLAVYGPALETNEYHPYSLIKDEKITYNGNYTPENYDHTYRGEVTIYEALKESKNQPAVWLLNEIGIPYAKEYLSKLGLDLPDDNNLSLALGGLHEGVTPIQMVQAYRAFQQEGKAIEPYAIIEIQNRNKEVIAQAQPKETKVFSSQNAWYLTKMLQAVVTSGSGTAGEYAKDLAGKTGSTQHPTAKQGFKDVWFVGYTPELVGALWIGYDVSDEKHYLTKGSSAPTELMKNILTELDRKEGLASQFQKPEQVEELPEPISLPVITDLKVDKKFSIFSGYKAKLTWTKSEDDRVIYRIYEKTKNGSVLTGEVTGKGIYEDESFNMFDKKTYYVVPYNPLTNEAGKRSNEVFLE